MLLYQISTKSDKVDCSLPLKPDKKMWDKEYRHQMDSHMADQLHSIELHVHGGKHAVGYFKILSQALKFSDDTKLGLANILK